MNSEEYMILMRLMAGDPDALCILYMQYSAAVQEFAFRMLRNVTDAEDLTHDVFLKVWESRKKMENVDSFQNYLFGITRNAILDTFRKRNVHSKWEDEHSKTVSDRGAEDKIPTNDLLRLIDMEVSKMPDQRRTVFYLSRMEKLSYNEIAEILNISPNTVKYHIKKALADLRLLINDEQV